jgi:hypothetical protein
VRIANVPADVRTGQALNANQESRARTSLPSCILTNINCIVSIHFSYMPVLIRYSALTRDIELCLLNAKVLRAEWNWSTLQIPSQTLCTFSCFVGGGVRVWLRDPSFARINMLNGII